MTFEELYQGLKKLGRPVAYDHFTEVPDLPFLAFIDEGKETFIADEKIWTKGTKIRLELYFETKCPDLEDRLEDILEEMGLLWEDEPTYYIDSERLYQHNYFFMI